MAGAIKLIGVALWSAFDPTEYGALSAGAPFVIRRKW